MAAKTMYFGTQDYATWVPAYDRGPSAPVEGWSASDKFINGGRAVRNSVGGSKMYDLTWALEKADDLRIITDYRSGMFGTGLIYWLDPMAVRKNILPAHFATPFQQGYDVPPMRGKKVTLQNTALNSLRRPIKTAVFETSPLAREIYVPIPPNHTAWLGVHGPNTGGTVSVVPATSATGRAPIEYITKIAVGSDLRYNMMYSGNTYRGLHFGVQSGAHYTSANCVILPDGETPAMNGDFISGQGNSGCSFDGDIMQTPYNANLELVGMTANLVEVGAWL